jgi:hypothetical protein
VGFSLFTTVSRLALGPTQPPIQWVPGALSLEVKEPGRKADHSPPSSARVKNAWSYTSTPPIRLHGVVLNYSAGMSLPFLTLPPFFFLYIRPFLLHLLFLSFSGHSVFLLLFNLFLFYKIIILYIYFYS